jgi:hypothetical protein
MYIYIYTWNGLCKVDYNVQEGRRREGGKILVLNWGEKYPDCITQCHVTITKYLRKSIYQEKKLILAHGSGSSSPRLGGHMLLGPWWMQGIFIAVYGEINCLDHDPGNQKRA